MYSSICFASPSLATIRVLNIMTEGNGYILLYKWIAGMCRRHSGLKELQGGEDESAEEKDNWIKDKWISYSGRHL